MRKIPRVETRNYLETSMVTKIVHLFWNLKQNESLGSQRNR